MDLAGTIGSTYRIPRQQPYNAGGAGHGLAQEASYDDGLAFEKNLQEVEGRTAEYYNKVAALKSFMADIHKNTGIDVRVPDMRYPESIRFNQIYQKALADIMHQGNLLKEGQVERTMHINRGDIYTGAAKGRPDSTLVQGSDYFNSQLPQDVIEINNLTQQPSYDDQSYQQKHDVYSKRYNELSQQIQDAVKAGDKGRVEYLQYQQRGLTPPARAIKQFAPERNTSAERMAGRKEKAAGNILKEITNLQHGVSDGYKVSETTFNPNNTAHALMVRPNFRDAMFGGKKIKEWGFDPKTDESFMFFEDGSVEDVTKQDPLTIARVMMGSNKDTFGVDAEYMDSWAEKNGILNDDGSINQEMLLRSNAAEIKKSNQEAYKKDFTDKKVKQLADFLEDLQKNKKSYLIGKNANAEIKIDKSPVPVNVEKRYNTEKLHIANFEEVFPKPKDKAKLATWSAYAQVYGYDSPGVDADDMRKFLQKHGAHLHMANEKTDTGKEVEAPQVEEDETAKKVDDAAKKKAEELINKYRK